MVLVLQVHFFLSNILLSCIYSKFIKFVNLAESLHLATNNMKLNTTQYINAHIYKHRHFTTLSVLKSRC